MTFFRAEDANQNHILWVSILHTTIYIFTYRVNVLISNTIYRWIRYKEKEERYICCATLHSVCLCTLHLYIYMNIEKRVTKIAKKQENLGSFSLLQLTPTTTFFGNFEERNETKTKRKNQQKNGKIYYTLELLLVNNYEKFYLFLLPTLRSTLYLYIYQLIFCYYTH